MKNTIWAFGDSFTEGYEDDWGDEYIKWKGYKPKNYTEILSEKLGMPLINFGKGGSDNYTIFENFCKNINNFKKDDIIIIGWTSIYRIRLVDNKNNWKVFMPGYDENCDSFPNLSVKTIQQIIVDRNSHLYIEELNYIIMMLDSIPKEYKLYQWTHCNDGKLISTLISHCERIFSETNQELTDGHYSENGNIQLTDYLLEIISGKYKIL